MSLSVVCVITAVAGATWHPEVTWFCTGDPSTLEVNCELAWCSLRRAGILDPGQTWVRVCIAAFKVKAEALWKELPSPHSQPARCAGKESKCVYFHSQSLLHVFSCLTLLDTRYLATTRLFPPFAWEVGYEVC